MKRILPLMILVLGAGMVRADSNSDYRAGADFARQIQGQGTGSIQNFKPQESIPGYNADPDETKYYGGVTAGGDGGLKNDGTTEWATGKTGKTITESFMNRPKDILSPDAPFIQTGRDVVNRADSIVGNTGQQCSAQQINRTEFTNYTCERDTTVEEYCTRTATMLEPKVDQPFVPTFNQTLYFINGDDPAQVAWMKRQTPPTLESKIILVQGSIPEMQKSLDSRIYFDQNGALCRRLGIDQVPARVTAATGARFLKVEFMPAEESRK